MRRIALLLAMVACEARTLDDHERHPMPPHDDMVDEDEEGGEDACPAKCNGVCVDLENDSNNCGICGHVCKQPDVYGPCEEGSCPAALMCSLAWADTCEGICSHYGQGCVDGEPRDRSVCAGEHQFYNTHGDALGICERRGDGNGGYDYEGWPPTCTEGIDWNIVPGPDPVSQSVACCCTQEPAP